MKLSTNGGNFPAQLPVLDGKNWERWHIQMKALFEFQDVMEAVKNGVPLEPAANASDATKRAYKDAKKRDSKAIFFLHQSVDDANFNLISKATSAKQAWEKLEKCYSGGDRVKKVKLQMLQRQFDTMVMEENEKIADFFARVKIVTNQMATQGETLSDGKICEKITRSLLEKYDYIVCAIEESKEVSDMSLEELQGSLEARELRLLERNKTKVAEQALLAKSGYKNNGESSRGKGGHRGRGRGRNNRGRGSYGNNGGRGQNNAENKGEQSQRGRGRGNYRGGNSGRGGGGKKKFDKSHIQCYNCDKWGHFADECYSKKDAQGDEANLAKGDDDESELVMLMVTTADEKCTIEEWYLDTGCSTHMTGHREWLVNFDSTKKNRIKFADGRTMVAEGVGNVMIKMENDSQSCISEVLYVPGLKNNLLSLGQLVEKGHKVVMEDKKLQLFDTCNKSSVIFDVPLSRNRTFKAKLEALKQRCLAATVTQDNWVWHHRYGHLNFRDLHDLNTQNMVKGLPLISTPKELCENCVESKQHREPFKKFIETKARDKLEVIHSDVCGPMQCESIGESRYFVSFLDDFTKKMWVYILKRKSEVLGVFKKFKKMVERQTSLMNKTLVIDGGGEYTSNEFNDFCELEGIVHDMTPPYTP